jgi:hypothetical protein
LLCAQDRKVFSRQNAGRRGADVNHADVSACDLSCDLRAVVDALRMAVNIESDAAAEERNDKLRVLREIEDSRAFQEELAPLRIKQWKPREIDASLINLSFSEVHIYGEGSLSDR